MIDVCDRRAAAGSLLAAAEAFGPRALEDHPALGAFGGLRSALGYLHERWVTLFGVA